MEFIKSKKSQGHIEVILSFILFLGALMLIFYFLNPLAKTEDKTSAIERVQRIILQNVTYTFGRLSVRSPNGNCDVNPSSCCYFFAPAKYNNMKYVETVPDKDNKNKIDIYFSNFFPNTINPHNQILSAGCDFTFGEFHNESIIYYNAVKPLAWMGKDNSMYNDMKKGLGLNYDFSFNFTKLDGTNIDELSFYRKVPSTVDVQAREFPVRVINSSGNINEYIFNLRVW